jgi:hypothetical protein
MKNLMSTPKIRILINLAINTNLMSIPKNKRLVDWVIEKKKIEHVPKNR